MHYSIAEIMNIFLVKTMMETTHHLVRTVIVFTQMTKKDIVPSAFIIFYYESTSFFVTKMPVPAHYSGFQHVRIFAIEQHFLVIICFNDYIVGFFKKLFTAGVRVPTSVAMTILLSPLLTKNPNEPGASCSV